MIKDLDAIAVSNWEQKIPNIAMKLVEEDSGKENKSYDVTLNLKFNSKFLDIDISIPFRNHDDEIAERLYNRDYIRSTNNHPDKDTWTWDTSDGVYWTLPYLMGDLIKHE